MYFVQFKKENMKFTVNESGADEHKTLPSARREAEKSKDLGDPVWRIIKVKKDKNGDLHMVSVHKLTR